MKTATSPEMPVRRKSLMSEMGALLDHPRMGTTVCVTIGEAISADARQSLWFLESVKSSGRSEEEVLQILERIHDADEACRVAVLAFKNGGGLDELEVALRNYVALYESQSSR